MSRAWIAVLLLVGCGGGTLDPAAQTQLEADAGIIRAVIQHRMKNWRHAGPRAQEILVLDTMAAHQSSQKFNRARAAGLGWGRPETWEAFFAAKTRRLWFPHSSTDSFTLISRGRVELAHDGKGDWDGSRIGHSESDGYFGFAGLSISEDGAEAIVEWFWHCGVLCADGWISRLVFEDGVWRLAETHGLWIS
jgi:hypothetical protein